MLSVDEDTIEDTSTTAEDTECSTAGELAH